MGQPQNKYHVTDNGDIYKVNDDGSFTAVGNVDSINQKNMVKTHPAKKSGWWRRNFNWLWMTTLVAAIGWSIVCISCSYSSYGIVYDEGSTYTVYNDYDLSIFEGKHIEWFYEDYWVITAEWCAIILVLFLATWWMCTHLKNRSKVLKSVISIVILILAVYIVAMLGRSDFLEHGYILLLWELAVIPFLGWLTAICLTLYSRPNTKK